MAELVDVDLTQIALDLGDALGGCAGLVRFIAKDRNTPKVLAEFQEAMVDWVIQLRHETVAHAKRLVQDAADVAELAQRLEQLVADPEYVRVGNNYGYEACREAIDERRRMLAFASAGSLTLDLSIAQIARVERTIRELDPSDVLVLQRLSRTHDPKKPEQSEHEPHHYRDHLDRWRGDVARQAEGRLRWVEGDEALPVLAASGCVFVVTLRDSTSSTPQGGLTVTPLGHRVVHVLRGYLLARNGDG